MNLTRRVLAALVIVVWSVVSSAAPSAAAVQTPVELVVTATGGEFRACWRDGDGLADSGWNVQLDDGAWVLVPVPAGYTAQTVVCRSWWGFTPGSAHKVLVNEDGGPFAGDSQGVTSTALLAAEPVQVELPAVTIDSVAASLPVDQMSVILLGLGLLVLTSTTRTVLAFARG